MLILCSSLILLEMKVTAIAHRDLYSRYTDNSPIQDCKSRVKRCKLQIRSSRCYEKVTEGSTTKENYYISTPAGVTSVYQTTIGTGAMYYLHPDYLGSVNFITNSSGSTVQELGFDAWGRQRNASNWSYSSLTAPMFDRGYTFHEYLPEFDLRNMNGRVYDPACPSS